MKYKRSVIMVMLIAMCFCLTGCFEPDPNYVPDIYELTSGQEALVTAPSAEYVVAALSRLDSILEIEIDTDIESSDYFSSDGSVPEAIVYFRSDKCDQGYYNENKSLEKTSMLYGGAIKVYSSFEKAAEEDQALSWADNKKLLYGGGHSIVGTLIVQTSSDIDIDVHRKIVNEITNELVSGTITDEEIKQAMAEYYSKLGMVISNLSEDDARQCDFEDLKNSLTLLGFKNISGKAVSMDYDDKNSHVGRVISVSINDESIEKGIPYDEEAEIIIRYEIDDLILVPASSIELEGFLYYEVEQMFRDAGFTNVRTDPRESSDYSDLVKDGSVIVISVNDDATFDEDARYHKDVLVRIGYRVFVEQTAPSETMGPVDRTTPDDNYVPSGTCWISQSGSKYHSTPYCSNMSNPTEVTIEQAISWGYTPCKRCH